MRINNNVMALNAHRQLGINQSGASKSMEKLSSGFRINRAGDDAAGLAISEKMRGQIRGLKQATRNAQDGISLIQTAEGALNETHEILQRMRELANQASTDTYTLEDRKEIQKEMNQLLEEIDRISNDTEFNTQRLLDGSYSDKILHIGANSGQKMDIAIGAMGTSDLGGGSGVEGAQTIATQAIASVEGVSGTTVLQAGGETVAVQVDSDWYAVDDVESDGSTLVAKADAEVLTVNSGSAIAGEVVTAASTSVLGVNDVNVYKNAAGEVVAAEASDGAGDTAYYALSDITENTGVLVGSGTAITVDNVMIIDGGGGTGEEGGNIGQLRVSDADILSATKESVATMANSGVLTQAGADEAISNVNDAINQVSAERSKLGAIQNRLEHTIANLGTSAENLQAAESRIRDLDMADEIMAFTKNNILQQAATAMLAQANMAPQSVLQLLG